MEITELVCFDSLAAMVIGIGLKVWPPWFPKGCAFGPLPAYFRKETPASSETDRSGTGSIKATSNVQTQTQRAKVTMTVAICEYEHKHSKLSATFKRRIKSSSYWAQTMQCTSRNIPLLRFIWSCHLTVNILPC